MTRKESLHVGVMQGLGQYLRVASLNCVYFLSFLPPPQPRAKETLLAEKENYRPVAISGVALRGLGTTS